MASGVNNTFRQVGIATGIATGALGAALVDLQPPENPALASLVNSAGPILSLGVGALVPLIRGDERSARPWMAGQALADGSDVAATLAAGKRLPRGGARFALMVAGVSTAVGAGAAAALGRRRMS